MTSSYWNLELVHFNIKLDFDSLWFMDAKSYQTSYYKALHKNFPEHGERVEVYIGK